MLKVLSYVRYSYASIKLDFHILLGAILFLLICGIIIIQIQIWDDEEYTRNKKWLEWKTSAIEKNKADLSNIYPSSKKNIEDQKF
tara:strand:- start:5533 stop:5787 length:255 start_codon:yes stop_codon:yes gene_type:complete